MLTGNMEFLQWDCQDVARWIESLGFPQYKASFTENHVTGRKLIYVNCVYMPRMGITDFKDMQAVDKIIRTYSLLLSLQHILAHLRLREEKVISACARELLGITEPPWSRSIAEPRRDTVGLFLERKSRTGERADALTFQRSLHAMSQAQGGSGRPA